ncbi:MAG: hypothetical protein AAI978_00090 [Candidatus Hodgkinia cicadicola]
MLISTFNIDGTCYMVKFLKLGKLLSCLQYGVLMLGNSSLISNAIAKRLRSYNNFIALLINNSFFWLMRLSKFDYVCYLKTKLLDANLINAKLALFVLSSILALRFICSSLRPLISNAFWARFNNAVRCFSIRFVKKLMWKMRLSELYFLSRKAVNALITLFGVCLFVLNINANELLAKYSLLKLSASLQFIANLHSILKLNIRKLLFNVWSLRALNLSMLCKFAPTWTQYKVWVLSCTKALQQLSDRKLRSLRLAFVSVSKRITNLLGCKLYTNKLLFDALGGWRVVCTHILKSIQTIVSLITVKTLLEWCNLTLMCCSSALYCLAFYKILDSEQQTCFVNALLESIKALRLKLLRLMLSFMRG